VTKKQTKNASKQVQRLQRTLHDLQPTRRRTSRLLILIWFAAGAALGTFAGLVMGLTLDREGMRAKAEQDREDLTRYIVSMKKRAKEFGERRTRDDDEDADPISG
jgi:hypothetical protein